MPVFTIETPSGRKLKIEAADQAAAIKGAQDWEAKNSRPQPQGAATPAAGFRPIKMADLRAAGIVPAEVKRPLRGDKRASGGLTGQITGNRSSWWDQLGAYSQAATEQIPFLDEAAAGAAALITGRPYSEVRGVQQHLIDEDRVERPKARVAGGVSGFGATVLAPAGAFSKAAQGKNLLTTTLRTAALGASTGAVQGFASDDGSVADRMDGAANGAMLGGAIGGAAPTVGLGAKTAWRAFNNLLGQHFVSPTASAAGRLRDALERDGVSPQKLSEALREFEQVGLDSPALLDVAGENTRALIRYAASRTGAGRNAAQAYRDTVAEGLPDAAQARARKLTPGEARPAGQYADDLRTARETAARTDYKGPYAEPVDVTPEIASAIRGEAGQAAIRRARAAAAARRDYGQVSELDQLLVGDLDTFPKVSAGTLDRIRIAMGERARTAGQRGANDMASGLRSRADDINSALDNVEGLTDARGNFRGYSQAIDAVEEVGPQILQTSPDMFEGAVAEMGPQARQAAQVGARQAIVDLMGQRANAAPALRQIAFAPNARRNLEALFGPEEAARYVQAAKLQLQRLENANFVAPRSGSQTFGREADADQLGGLIDAASGKGGGLVSMALDKLRRGLTLTEREADALVEMGLMQPQKGLEVVRPTLSQRAGAAVTAPQLSVVAPTTLAAQAANRR